MVHARLLIFHCGFGRVYNRLLSSQATSGETLLPFMGFCVVHPTGGPVLIDAPHGPQGARGYGPVRGRLFGLAERLTFQRSWSAEARVREAGLAPTGVQEAILTHLHIDHTGGVAGFPNARWSLSATELEYARAHRRGLRRLWAETRINFGDVDVIERNPNPIRYEGPSIEQLGASWDLFGDGVIRAVPLPGHSPGHQGVLVRLERREVLLCGDAAFSIDHIRSDIDPGPMVMSIAEQRCTMLRTLERLRAFARARPDVAIIPSHDAALGERVLEGPLWFE